MAADFLVAGVVSLELETFLLVFAGGSGFVVTSQFPKSYLAVSLAAMRHSDNIRCGLHRFHSGNA
jgi:hypothetical protein